MNKKIVSGIVAAVFVGVLAVGGALFSSSIAATGNGTANRGIAALLLEQKFGPLVHHLSGGKLKLVSTFAGPDGLTGIIAEPVHGGQKTIVWGVKGPQGEYLIPGPVMSGAGQNLTVLAAQSHGLMPKPMPAEEVAAKALEAPGFILGKKGPVVAVFMDPNCIFCHKFYEEIMPDVLSGKIRLKVIPVAFLKPSSMPKDVTVLDGVDPAVVWANNEAMFNDKTEEGGTKPSPILLPKVRQEILENTRLLVRTGEMSTPTIVACMQGAKVPEIIHGIAPHGVSKLVSGAVDLLPGGGCRG